MNASNLAVLVVATPNHNHIKVKKVRRSYHEAPVLYAWLDTRTKYNITDFFALLIVMRR